jgi:hypothetical protein
MNNVGAESGQSRAPASNWDLSAERLREPSDCAARAGSRCDPTRARCVQPPMYQDQCARHRGREWRFPPTDARHRARYPCRNQPGNRGLSTAHAPTHGFAPASEDETLEREKSNGKCASFSSRVKVPRMVSPAMGWNPANGVGSAPRQPLAWTGC